MSKNSINIISINTDMVISGIGYSLRISEETNIKGKGYYHSRIFASEAEAEIAKGILMLLIEKKGINEEFYSEYDFLLKATLRMCYSEKTWSE